MSCEHDKYTSSNGWLQSRDRRRARGVGRAMVGLELRTRLIIYLFTPVCSGIFADIDAAFISRCSVIIGLGCSVFDEEALVCLSDT